ncbi:inhibitor of cysteine proteases, putative [Plasmodium chabaudi chabaudi]|uniref:Inhibitor of cysteine proteases, putative n=1 Tax=Plasmodium chabaudi chabaudi TaxID=31271 RepID=A0A4V0K5Z0_PLACU|nr:inhibitor of cysteine proteases, putative [Plasmodium chabaudi chabaudi]VTZ68340.1 inhibitor of cysteine proteases, putative [Plasmodium chabaudi chabaudi]|eukprot:XP_016653764.1 inhibitor of cysteine proteases, putative [Plasmodium chabaudi chabaudi]
MKSITFFVLNICSTLVLLSHCEDNNLYSFDIVNETSWLKIAKKIFKEKSPSNFTVIPFNKEHSDDNESDKEESILLIRKKIKSNNGNSIIPGDGSSDDIGDFSLNFTPNNFSDKNEDTDENSEYPTTSYKPSDDLNSNSSFIEESEKVETESEADSENKNKDININSNLEKNNTMNESDKVDSKYELTGNEKCDNSMKLGNILNQTNQETINKSLSVGETFCINFEGNAGTGYLWVLLGVHKNEPTINPEEFPKKILKKQFFSEEISVTQPKKFKINELDSSKNVGEGNNSSGQNENDSNQPKKPKMQILGGPEPVRSVIKGHKPGKYYVVYSYYRPFSPASGANTKIVNLTVQ